jgi:MFS family permease
MSRSGIITKSILIVSLVSLFNDIASEMLYPIMPVFLRSIGFSVLLIGILEGIAEATAGLSKGYFGNLSDIRNRRVPFIRYGYLFSAISKPMMAMFIYPAWIFFARTLDRLGKGVRTSARDAILSDESTQATKGRVFGFHRMLDTVGAAIGPVVALVFLWFYPQQYRWLFLIAFLPGIAAVLMTLFLKDKKKESVPGGVKPRVSFFGYFSYWKKADSTFRILTAGLLLFALFNSSDAFLLLSLKDHGFTDSQVIGFYIFYNLVFALFAYPIGALGDRIGLKRTLIGGLVLFAFVYCGFAFALPAWSFAVLLFIYGIYAASTDGISRALITNIAHPADTATALGFFNSFSSIFSLLASTLSGLLWYTFGSSVMFIVSAAGALAVAGYFILKIRIFAAQLSE